MINELDVVALTHALPDQGLAIGDVGTVVHVYKDGQAYEVEFMTLTGETIAVVTLDADAIRPVEEHEIANARQVA
jgi:hypothetical protein